jgi:hypothetical protein
MIISCEKRLILNTIPRDNNYVISLTFITIHKKKIPILHHFQILVNTPDYQVQKVGILFLLEKMFCSEHHPGLTVRPPKLMNPPSDFCPLGQNKC